jgi:WD40 repeat protein
VLAIKALDGANGSLLISGAADHVVRVWNMKEAKRVQKIDVSRPSDEQIEEFNFGKGRRENLVP